LATDYFPIDRPSYVQQLLPPEQLDQLLPQADIVFLCAPLTDLTRNMMNRAAFNLMPKGSVLINIARGGLVAEDDLVEALRSGQLAGAGIDVAAEEPLPTDSPLWGISNLIITPHVGGQSARRIDQMTDFFCDNLRRYQAGEPLLNRVDKKLGFPNRP
jgi:D-3-phosphoglycerate dehydrogenase